MGKRWKRNLLYCYRVNRSLKIGHSKRTLWLTTWREINWNFKNKWAWWSHHYFSLRWRQMRNFLLNEYGIWRRTRQSCSTLNFLRKSKYGKLPLELFQRPKNSVAFKHLLKRSSYWGNECSYHSKRSKSWN